MIRSFKFSIVIPAYNAEPFIAEAIESVIAQDIGFQNIQLILVDDGSTDGTGAVVDRYAKKYPDNIIALHQKNAGVSAARNAGLALATGKYVNCLDADDMWECHVFSRVFAFFEAHYDETDIVSCPIYHFRTKPNKKKPYYLNHKFKNGSRVILLDEDPKAMLLHCAGVFIRRDAIELPFFDPGLPISEDCLAMQTLLLKRQTLGVVGNCPYWYRERSGVAQPSITQEMSCTRFFWLDRLERFHLKIFRRSLDILQYIPKFTQYAVCDDLFSLLQFKQFPREADLRPEDTEKFYRLLHEILRQVEDVVLIDLAPHPGLSFELRMRALRLKYGRDPVLTPLGNDLILGFPPEIGQIKRISKLYCALDFLTILNNVCTLEGRFHRPAALPYDEIGISVMANGVRHEAKMSIYQDARNHVSLGDPVFYQHMFHVEIPINSNHETTEVRFFLCYNGITIPIPYLVPHKFFPLTRKYSNEFVIIGGVKCTLLRNSIRLSYRYSTFRDELRFMKELWQKNRNGSRKAVATRILYHILKFFKRKPIWLCSDRPEKADDNGEVFFEYLRKNHPEIDSYFVLNRDSPDWDRLKKIGPVVENGSRKHKKLRLLADRCVSTQTQDYAEDILRKYYCYHDILSKCKTVFLQHGVIKDDLSSWLRKYSQNLAGFVTTAPRERQSILDGEYGYGEKEVWLTGLPRHDRLYNDPKKKISIMPTWRKNLLGQAVEGKDLKQIIPLFNSSNYRKFYHDLLNHERLLKCAKTHGYQVCFLPHPQLQKFVAEFGASPSVQVYGFDRKISYREIFAESELVVTDYSSAVFDFAYLRKPVIYAHFDKDEIFVSHIYSHGYFEYERDGFGEVEYDLESTVDRIIEYMENGCQLKDKYRERIDHFFKFHDRNNCQRVFEKIANITGALPHVKA